MPSYLEVFKTEGEIDELAGNNPLLLDDPETVWLVGSGRVEVFAVPLRHGEPSGARRHLFRVEAGQLLFSTQRGPDDAWGLVAVGVPQAQVFRLAQSRVRRLACDPDSAATLAQRLDEWIERLTASVARGQAPRRAWLLEAGDDRRVEANTMVRPADRALWIASSPGGFLFLGRMNVSLDPADWFPVAGSAWLATLVETHIKAGATAELIGDGRLWAALDGFHQAILSLAALNAEEAAAAERNRLERKSASEARTSQAALAQLASVLEADEIEESLSALEEDPLLAACRLVGERMGFAVQAPRSLGEKTGSDPVGAVARASGVRARRVLLAGDWWRQDNGPLLAFRALDTRPVALLPTSPSTYELVDPVARSRTLIDEANASIVHGFAYCWYRAFPPRELRPWDVVKFSLAGTRRDVMAIVLLGLVAGLLGMLVPIATGLVIGWIIPGAERQQLLLLVLALASSAAAMALLQFAQGVAMLRMETRMDTTVEAGIWDRLLNLPTPFFRQYTAGDLALRAMGIGRIRQALTEAAMSSLLTFAFSLVIFALLFYLDLRLALVATAVFVVILGAICLAAALQLKYERSSYHVRGRVAGLVLQLLTGISRLRVAGAESRATALWAKDFSLQTRLAFQAQAVANHAATFITAMPLLGSLAVFATMALASGPTLSLAAFLAFNAAFVQVVSAAVMMGSAVTSVLGVIPLYERAKPILQTLPEFHKAKRHPGELTGDIEISHASFRYHADGPLILDDVCLHFRPGEFVALVGPSGAGKSTVLRLLLGFETPNAGSVYYDGEDLAGLDHQAVRRQIGVVLQSSRLTPGDILSNITGGSPLFTLDDAWEAARRSGLEEDIKQMPMGMFTVVSEGESTLSGGQRQRLLIARAIVAKPRILLFDEATSALDNVTQAHVAKSLENLKATRVVVAHRLSTIMKADAIYVLDRGKIVQHGRYEDLIGQPGMFAELVKRQVV